jgi:hypothetical protein
VDFELPPGSCVTDLDFGRFSFSGPAIQ